MTPTHDDFIRQWGKAADTKLRAEHIDPTDLEAVETCLLRTVGGRRLFNAWVEWDAELQVEADAQRQEDLAEHQAEQMKGLFDNVRL